MTNERRKTTGGQACGAIGQAALVAHHTSLVIRCSLFVIYLSKDDR